MIGRDPTWIAAQIGQVSPGGASNAGARIVIAVVVDGPLFGDALAIEERST
jgi:hypothetical protein